jgi:hypothetical protein
VPKTHRRHADREQFWRDTIAAWRQSGLPESAIGEAVTYATNQWPTLGVYLTDGRLTIDNGPAEQAICPLAIGRKNWLHTEGTVGRGPPPCC